MKDFITDLIKKDIHINLVDGELSVRFPKNEVDQLILAELKAKKQAIKDYLSGLEKDRFVVIPALTMAESYPISDAQRRLWVLSQFEGGSAAYNIAGSIALNQDIDIEKFKKAIASTIERHEILRTVFKTDELGEVRQWILQQEDLGFEIGYGDFRKSQDKQQQVEAYIKQDTYKPFDLERGPLLRAGLLQLDDASYVFYINMHHIICDGWSLEVLSRDVFSYYESYKNNKQSGLKALRIQYKDYSSWQLAQLKKESFKAHREYWLDNLKGELPLVDLPAGKQRPRVKTNNGYGLSIYIDSPTSHKLKAYAGANGGSLFMSLLAAWNILLYRYTSQKDIIIGTPIAGREHADLEDQIGFYVNTLALRNEISPAESFNDFYKKLKDNTLKSYSHQAYPFDRLVDDLHLQRDTSRSVVFDMLLVQNYGEKVQGPALTKEQISQVADLGYSASKFDIELSVKEISDYLLLNVVYNTDVYERGMVENLLRHYRQLLTALLENPEEKISHINYLLPAEKNELLLAFNDKAAEYPEHQTVVDLFEQQAIKTPGHAALVFGERIISYKDLNESANQLAAYLRDVYKVKRGDCVGFKLERSENIIITIFGILKAGAAYLPMDIDSPEEKVNYISTDSKTVLIIDARELEVFNAQRSKYQNTNLPEPAGVEDLVYVIYTSGSTGQPKGVAIEHKGLAAHIHNVKELYGVSAKSRFLQFFNVAFDAAAQEIFTSLCFGATLYLKTPEVDPEYIYDLIAKHKITHADFSTAFFNSFIASFKPGRFTHKMDFCAVGGEKLEKGTVEKQLANIASFTKNFYNVYGPTETTLTATWFGIIKNGKLSGLDAIIPIGRPYAGRQVLIVDEHQQLLPKEVIGEICIGGDGLARGYLNQDALSKEKFIASPFKAGERLYKTGDLGRWLADGNIEFIGRKDDQVKIRGYRIELGEIEHALLRHEQLTGAVVLVKKNEQSEKELVAYITAQAAQNTSALRSFLQKILPEYMVPAYYVQLEALPLTSNGKVDKKLLPDPQGLGLSSGMEYIAPRTEQEKVLVAVWKDVLKREGIGVKDSFYNLGGDSIKSIQVVSRLKQQGYSLKVENILRTPVLEELAMLMQQSTQVIDQSEVKGAVELTPIQHWFFEASEIKVHAHFNQSVLLQSKEQLDENIIEKSIAELVRHHDALRMVYKNEAGVWKQINQDTTTKSYTINFYDLSRADDAPGQMSQIGEALQASIDLGKGPLFKVVHFKLKDSDRLGLIIHHLVVDGVSWRILLEDLSTLYTNYKAGKKAELPLKTDSFQRWALLQKEYAKGDAIKKEKAYWETLCSQKIQGLPQDKKIKEKQAVIDASESFRLDKATTELLQTRVHGIYNTEINDVLLTGLGLAIKEIFSREKSVLKMEGHGREELVAGVDISRTVGWFTTTYPFVLDVSEAVHPTESLVAVKESLRKVPNKGIGYGILNYLSKALGNAIKPEILFNYLGDFGTHAGNDKNAMFDYASESIGQGIAKENGNHAVLDVSGIMVAGELSLSVRYSQLRYNSATIQKLVKSYEKNLKSLIKELSKSKTTYLTPSDLSFKGLGVEELSKINPGNNVEDVYELSPMQEGIYYHWLSETSSLLYFEQTSYRTRSKGLEIEKLKEAYNNLIARHGVLRTSFSMDYAGRPLQIVRKSVPGNFTYEKIKGKAGKQNFVEQVKQKDREKGFDLAGPSQMRLHVVDLEEDAYEFIWSFHHILMDGWCMSVLINDFNELLGGNTLNLPPVIPYSNYIHWIKTLNKESSLAYWKNYLSGYSQVAEVPFKIGTGKAVYTEKRESLKIEGPLFKKLDALCHQTGITHSTFIQGVWGYLLSRYNNTNDVVFGAVVSGRPAELPGVEEMIGLFINTIPIRVKYEPGNTPVELLKALQEQSIQSTSHHYVNLSEVQSQSEPGKNLVDHIMVFENYAVKELTSESLFNTQKEEGFSIESTEVFEQTNYDFNITVSPSAGAFTITIAYNANQYDSLLLEKVREHFDALVHAFTEHANEPLHTLNYLSGSEKHALLYTYNNTAIAYPKDKTIIDLFEEQVTKTPDHVAVAFEENTLSYQQLDELSNQLAHYLKTNYAIAPDDLVGIKLERSAWMIVSVLGVLKSGGAYVPIDPGYPQERIDYIEKDTSCKVCIDEHELSRFRTEQTNYAATKITAAVKPGSLAYVIYTSGSTGQPKGVMIEHGNVVRLFKTDAPLFDFSSSDVWTMFHSYAFDFSVWEMYGALLFGGKLVVVPKLTAQDTALYLELLAKEGVTVLNQTPSAFYNLSQEDKTGKIQLQIRYVIFGGEALSPGRLQHWHNRYPNCRLINMYGITETTVHTTYKEIGQQEITLNRSNIGKAIPTVSCMVLDENKNLVPVGVAGELYIGGAGLARGYLNRQALTNERFIAHPFAAGERLYKTGDKAKQLANGDFEYLGRIDNQVKIRGHRIELGEIEHALLKNKHIEEAVVIAKDNQNNEKELVAYITAKTEQNISDLKNHLKETLPVYMLPAYYVQLETLPLTANGKVDKKALPDPQGLGLASGTTYVAPKNEAEEKLVDVWAEVLGIEKEKIGINDNFFDLGGDSIKVLRLMAGLRKRMDYQLSVADIYNNDTIEKIAAYAADHKKDIDVKSKANAESESSVRKEIEGLKARILFSHEISNKENIEDLYPMSDIEKGMVFGYIMNEGTGTYHDQMVFQRSFPQFNIERFQRALALLTHKHSILRTGFNLSDYECEVQIVYKKVDNIFEFKDLSDLSKQNQEEIIKAYLASERARGFIVSQAPLWRMSAFGLGQDHYAFVFQFHHAIIDGWSNASFMTELNNLYLQLEADIHYKPAPLKASYKDFIVDHEMNRWDETIKDFWKKELFAYERLDLFTGEEELGKYSRLHDNNYLKSIEHVAKTLNTTVKVVSLSAYLYLLKILNYNAEIVTGLVTNTRPAVEDGDKILGCFLNTIPLKVQVDGHEQCSDLIQRVHEKLIALKNNEKLSTLAISSICQEKPERSNPFFDVLFNYVDFHAYKNVVEDTSTKAKASAINVENYERSNTFFDFTVSTTGGVYLVDLSATKKIKSGLSANYIVNLYFKILDFILKDAGKLLIDIDYLSEKEKHEQLFTFNATAAGYPKDKTIIDLFEEQVAKTPDDKAVVFKEKELTYLELSERSDQLAHYLKTNYAIQPDDLVGIKLERSEWMIIAVLGVLKSGGAYVPIDPNYPQERIDYIEKDTSCKVCIDEEVLSNFKKDEKKYSKEKAASFVKASNLAYVIYTSGSTGKPKGVMVEHKNVINFFTGMTSIFGEEPGTFLSMTNFTFDISVLELLWTLSNGYKVVIQGDVKEIDDYSVYSQIKKHQVTHLQMTPSMGGILNQHLTKDPAWNSMKKILLGGERLTMPLVKNLYEKLPQVQLYNMYGPTETTIWSTVSMVNKSAEKVLIGKPIANTSIYIFNDHRHLLPVGIQGEIYIGGEGVARGYTNKELTAQRFIENPYRPGERLYRTGDFGSWLSDGSVDYSGRKDEQVKIRGYRIELGEIEHALLKNEHIEEAVVIAKENEEQEKELVAYITGHKKQSAGELRIYLKELLPEYMLPAHFIQLDALPLNSSGKIDRKALPDPKGLGLLSGTEYIAPRNETEEQLLKIWQDVLRREHIGVKDDFFALGGHSLSATQLIIRLEKSLGVKIGLRNFLAKPTIEDLSEAINTLNWMKDKSEEVNAEQDEIII